MLAPEGGSASEEDFHTSLRKAFAAPGRPQHTKRNVLSWVTQTRSKVDFHRTHIPLNSVTAEGWDYTGSSISHQSGNYFSVIAVNVEAESREVRSWSQPLISPSGMGLIVLITKRINGTLHALVHARMEAGVLNIAELAPTIQCRPRNYDQLPQELHPRYLDFANAVDPLQVHYNVVHSDEGGRFYHSVSRHMVIEAERDFAQETPADYMWLTFWQLTKFLEHGNYLNIELRSLLACAASMT
jgi:oxidase EvaA